MAHRMISIEARSPVEVRTPLLALAWFRDDDGPDPVIEAVDGLLGGAVARLRETGDFRGKLEETSLLYSPSEAGPRRVLLVGAGPRAEYGAERARIVTGAAARAAEKLGLGELALLLDPLVDESRGVGPHLAARAAAEAAVLASWRFDELKTGARDDAETALERCALVHADERFASAAGAGARDGAVAADGANLARSLAMRPGNVATPEHLAEVARDIAQRAGLRVTVLDRAAIEREEMGALLAVAQGSNEEPRFIVLEYDGADEADGTVALIGKGVTFDSGGISLKPADKMEQMKYDMSGAAAVLGAMQALGELRPAIRAVGLIPATENLPSGTAFKPGDVIRTHAGRTVEVINTDAEGRLILADALSYAQRYRPRAMLDAATLTGACVVALGHHAIGLLGSDDALVAEVREAGERAGERCWQLPLWAEYRKQLDSQVADIQNSGGRPAGTITAAWFLREFAGDVPWAHLDIAGTAWRDEVPAYLRKGPTGVPTRLMVEWVRSRAGE